MSRRILIVDDEDDIREVAQVSLELVGHFEVLTAASGREGLERARGERPDAILLDVMMPDMDGPATLAHCAATAPCISVPKLPEPYNVIKSDHCQIVRQISDLTK